MIALWDTSLVKFQRQLSTSYNMRRYYVKSPADGGDQTAGKGLEVPCTYTFEGKPKMIKELKLFSRNTS